PVRNPPAAAPPKRRSALVCASCPPKPLQAFDPGCRSLANAERVGCGSRGLARYAGAGVGHALGEGARRDAFEVAAELVRAGGAQRLDGAGRATEGEDRAEQRRVAVVVDGIDIGD